MDAEERQHENLKQYDRKPRQSTSSTPENGTETAAVLYKKPTKAERDEIVNILSQSGGFDILFRPAATTGSGGTGQGKAASYYSDRYVNIPEENKGWKDDDALLLDSADTPADFLKFASKRLQLNNQFIFKVIRRRGRQLLRDDAALPRIERRYGPPQRSNGSSLCDAIGSILGHADSALLNDKSFFQDYYNEFEEDLSRAKSSHVAEVEIFLYSHFGPTLKNDSIFIHSMFLRAHSTSLPTLFKNVSYRLRDDPNFILATVGASPERSMLEGAIRHASTRLLDDPIFLLQAQKKLSRFLFSTCPYQCVLESASHRLRDDEGFILQILEVTDAVKLNLVSRRLQNDKPFILKFVELSGDGMILRSLPKKFRDDVDVVSQCIHQWSELGLDGQTQFGSVEPRHRGSPLRFASARIRDNLDVAKQAIKYDPLAFLDASTRLRSDKNLVLCALQSLRDCSWDVQAIETSNNDRYRDNAVSTEADVCSRIRCSFNLITARDLEFIRKALKIYPFVLNYIHSEHWLYRDELPELISIALGSVDTSDKYNVRDFWIERVGRAHYRKKLTEFWTSNRLCIATHTQIHVLSSRLDDVGGPGWDLLIPLFDRKRGRKKRFDGFTTTGFSVDDWKGRMYERIWLVDRIFASFCCDKSTALPTSEKSNKLNTDILKHIVGFTGIDGILGKSNDLRKFEPLFSTLVERSLVVPEVDDDSSSNSEMESEYEDENESEDGSGSESFSETSQDMSDSEDDFDASAW